MRRFLWYILKEDGRSAKVVNNVVTYTGQPTPLPQTGDGWQSMSIGWERNLSDHGVTRNFTLPFGYVRDALKILRDALYNQSIEEKLFLLIQVLGVVIVPGISYNWLYQYLYKGELDLAAAEDNLDMINVPCMEGGLYKMLKANRATKYTFPFDIEAVTVVLDGIALAEKAHYVLAGPVSNLDFLPTHTIPIAFVNKEGTSTGTGFFSQNVEEIPAVAPYVAASTNYFLINTSGAPRTYNVKGVIRYTCTVNSAGLSYRWFFSNNGDTGDPGSVNIYNSGTNPVPGTTYEVPVDVNLTLNDGQKYFLFGRFFGAGGVEIAVDFLDTSYFDITFESTAPETRILAYTKDVLFKKLIGKVTGNENNASSLLCEDKKYTVVTSGDAIRKVVDPVIITSLDDFYDDMDATYMAGLGIENDKIEIESRIKYYDSSAPVDLGIIKDLVISPANEFRASRFKFGHVKPDIEDINGKYDPNGSNVFSGPLLKSVNEYSRISPYKAGPYEIESIRINLDGKVTTDDNRDNEVYVINCDSHKTVLTDAVFTAADNSILIPTADAEFLASNQQIQIAGSAGNNGTFNILGIGNTVGANTYVFLSGPLVDEASVAITITVLRGEVLTLNRPAYTTLEGVPNDTIFNLPDLTPKAMLLTHGRWIKSMHKGLENQKLIFNSGDKNTALKTVLAGVTIDEDKDELISALGDIMFMPFFANFATEVPVNIVDILEASPNRCFTAFDEARGVQIEGFLMSAGFAPNDLKEQEFRLLLSPNNDLSLLT